MQVNRININTVLFYFTLQDIASVLGFPSAVLHLTLWGYMVTELRQEVQAEVVVDLLLNLQASGMGRDPPPKIQYRT